MNLSAIFLEMFSKHNFYLATSIEARIIRNTPESRVRDKYRSGKRKGNKHVVNEYLAPVHFGQKFC